MEKSLLRLTHHWNQNWFRLFCSCRERSGVFGKGRGKGRGKGKVEVKRVSNYLKTGSGMKVQNWYTCKVVCNQHGTKLA